MSTDRQLGVDLFNETWRLMGAREDDVRMVTVPHASAYHWSVAQECKPENVARVAREPEQAQSYEQLARDAGEKIADPEDRELLLKDLATLAR